MNIQISPLSSINALVTPLVGYILSKCLETCKYRTILIRGFRLVFQLYYGTCLISRYLVLIFVTCFFFEENVIYHPHHYFSRCLSKHLRGALPYSGFNCGSDNYVLYYNDKKLLLLSLPGDYLFTPVFLYFCLFVCLSECTKSRGDVIG